MISKIKNHIGCIRRRLLGRLDLLRILHTENAGSSKKSVGKNEPV